MAKDFYQNFSAARLAFEEADALLGRPLSSIILNGPVGELTETRNSQAGIYVASMAILRVVQELYDLKPYVCAGLSLGEYSALTAGGWLSFIDALPLVQHRGQFMNEACESFKGSMAVIMGLETGIVEEIVKQVNLPNDLWVANYNCPGQVVISGTLRGVEAGMAAAKSAHAKRVLPLQVHGAFHSPLMQIAKEKLTPFIQKARLKEGSSQIVMNVTGDFVKGADAVKRNIIDQVTHPVLWEQGIRAMEKEDVDVYIEFGPGKTLSGLNKRIGVRAPTLSIEQIEDLEQIGQFEREEE